MKIGYLHLGPFNHGINRYGRLLATECQQRSDLVVLQAEVILTNDKIYNYEAFINAAKCLSQADIIHIQFSYFNDYLWGSDWEQIENLRVFVKYCSCPIVVTLHDVYYVSDGFKKVLKCIFRLFGFKKLVFETHIESEFLPSVFKKIVRSVRELWMGSFGVSSVALKELAKHAQLIFVCSREEAQRLKNRVDPKKLKIIPHFVEARLPLISSTEARKSLGLEQYRVITVLGYIFPSKGHQLVLEAIQYLPLDIHVIFAGSGEASEDLACSLMKFAEENGIAHRIHLTGYLPEQDLEKCLMATELAICAFRKFSASGSISTWISVNCPILASDLPQIREYNELEVDAINVFKPYKAIVLATEIQRMLEGNREAQRIKISNLAKKLSLSNILNQHLSLYKTLDQNFLVSTTYQE